MQHAGSTTGGKAPARKRGRTREGDSAPPPKEAVAMVEPPPFADELWACLYCNYCSAECPTAREVGWESTSPRGRIRLFHAIRDRWHRKDGVRVPQAFIRSVYECTSCRRCSEVCHVDIDLLAHNEEWRRWLARSGCGPLEDHRVLTRSLDNYRNPYLSPSRDRARWAEGLDLPRQGEVLYFAGCSDSFVHPDVARRTVEVLRALGHDVAYLGTDEPCCGSTLARLGLEDDFRRLAGEVRDGMASSGARLVVTACPGCSSAFREYYMEAGIDLAVEVLHVTEVLDRALAEGRLGVDQRLEGSFAWYDPCHLGRVDGVFEAPRRVLAACVERVVELSRNRKESMCCGSGGGLKTAFPDQAVSIGRRVVEMARDAGATTLVTACPWCETNIGDAAAGDPRGGPPVVDLVTVVHAAMGLGGGTPAEDVPDEGPGAQAGRGRGRRTPGRL